MGANLACRPKKVSRVSRLSPFALLLVVFVITQLSHPVVSTPAGARAVRPPPSVQAIATDPENTLAVYVGTLKQGILKSDDGGRRWHALGFARRPVSGITVDPRNSRTVYAADGRLFRSADGGSTWHELRSPNPRIGVAAVAVDPTRSDTLYAATGTGCTACDVSGLFKSTDDGRNWRASLAFLEAGASAVVVDPRNPERVYANLGRYTDLSVSIDGGVRWKDLRPPPNQHIETLAIDPANTQTLYAGTGDGVFKSADRGLTWRPASAGLPKRRDVNALATDAQHPGVIYASVGWDHHDVFRSTNAGRNWKRLNWSLR